MCACMHTCMHASVSACERMSHVCVCVCVCACMYGLRIVSTDMILSFINTSIYLFSARQLHCWVLPGAQYSKSVSCNVLVTVLAFRSIPCNLSLLFLLSDPYRVAMPPNKKGVYDNGDILYDSHTYPRGDTRPKVSAHVQVNSLHIPLVATVSPSVR